MERRELLGRLGAEVVLTPGSEGMKGVVRRAEEWVAGTPGAFMPDQFANPANPAVHRETTALEIWGGRLEGKHALQSLCKHPDSDRETFNLVHPHNP